MGNISPVRVGGVCAVLAVVSGIMARIFFGLGDLVTGRWFDVLYLLLGMPAALGFFQALHEAESCYGLPWRPSSPVSSFFFSMSSSD